MRHPIDKTDRIYMFMTGFGCLLYFIAFVVLAIGCFMVSFDLIITSLIIGVIGGVLPDVDLNPLKNPAKIK